MRGERREEVLEGEKKKKKKKEKKKKRKKKKEIARNFKHFPFHMNYDPAQRQRRYRFNVLRRQAY